MTKLTGQGNTELEKTWRKSEQGPMTHEDCMLGGPKKTLSLSQFAKANGFSIKTGRRR